MNKQMYAGVLKSPGKLEVEKIDVFSMADNQVLIEVKACGICGSDIRYFHGENPWALHTLGTIKDNPPNIVLGHEFAGKIVQVGSKKNEELLGKNVAVICFKTCGKCEECKNGADNLCKSTIHIGHGAGWGIQKYYPGAMAEYCLGWPELCFPVPDGFPLEEVAMMDVIAVGVHAVKQAAVRKGSTLAVIGAGPIGNAIMQAAFALGADKVWISDIYDKAIQIAQECGASRVINSKIEKFDRIIMEETYDRGVDAVLDTVGSVETFQAALSVLAPGGVLVNMAVHGNELSFKGTAIGSERCVKSSCNFKIDDFELGLKSLLERKLNVKPWITHRVSLSGFPESLRMLEEKEKHGAFKIIVDPSV